jgi:16S rRNA (guanine1207-N2)-methyltransferase
MPHYYDSQPTGEEHPAKVEVRISGLDYLFDTAGGVFSGKRVDFGTLLLIEAVARDLAKSDAAAGKMLDLGCGYGPVGIAMKRMFPVLDVVLSDVNARALRLAESNARQNRTPVSAFIQSDGFEAIDGMFDLILTNPPIRAGKSVVHRFFTGSFEHLNPGGMLYTVMQKKQGAPSAASFLTECFGNCAVVDISAGYRVMKCLR